MRSLLEKKRLNLYIWLFLFALIVGFCIFFYRFPNNFFYPNFYAEDGRDFTANIINNGFLRSSFTTFNGYYIFGLYFLTGVAIAFNSLFTGDFIFLPQTISIISYATLSLIVSLPIILFRQQFTKFHLCMLMLISAFVPLAGSDYAIIGSIGNLKFIFSYIAFLLILYRHFTPLENRKYFVIIDFFLLFCAYTNLAVYFIIPAIAIRYAIPFIRKKITLKALLNDFSFRSMIILVVLLSFQPIMIFLYGLSTPAGYLTDPFEFKKTIEILFARPYLFSVFFPIYKELNDLSTLLIMLLLIGAILRFGDVKHRFIYWFGLYAIFIITFSFVATRTGISFYFEGYKQPGGPSQFFYTQNLIFLFLIGVLCSDMIRHIRTHYSYWNRVGKALIIVYLLAVIPDSGSFGKNNFMQHGGIFVENAKIACSTVPSTESMIDVVIYPEKIWKMTVPRNIVCNTALASIIPKSYSFGLELYQNTHIGGITQTNQFTQTFIAPHNNLNGIDLFISTFVQNISTPYVFYLKDSTCTQIVRKVDLIESTIKDNSYHSIQFEPIMNSEEQQYCFTLEPEITEIKTPLTVQLSQPDAYLEGKTIVLGEERNQDVVFKILYKKRHLFFDNSME